jgi:hypothetical protein
MTVGSLIPRGGAAMRDDFDEEIPDFRENINAIIEKLKAQHALTEKRRPFTYFTLCRLDYIAREVIRWYSIRDGISPGCIELDDNFNPIFHPNFLDN